jgi:hypothetical protein
MRLNTVSLPIKEECPVCQVDIGRIRFGNVTVMPSRADSELIDDLLNQRQNCSHGRTESKCETINIGREHFSNTSDAAVLLVRNRIGNCGSAVLFA